MIIDLGRQQHVHAERPIRQFAYSADFSSQDFGWIAIERHDSQPAGLAYRGGQFGARHEAHRGADDRPLNSQQSAKRRIEIHCR
jgi:hypothetical protein